MSDIHDAFAFRMAADFVPVFEDWTERHATPKRMPQMEALRGLCRANGIIGTHRHWLRVEAFNQRQRQHTGSVQDIPFTVVGTKLNNSK